MVVEMKFRLPLVCGSKFTAVNPPFSVYPTSDFSASSTSVFSLPATSPSFFLPGKHPEKNEVFLRFPFRHWFPNPNFTVHPPRKVCTGTWSVWISKTMEIILLDPFFFDCAARQFRRLQFASENCTGKNLGFGRFELFRPEIVINGAGWPTIGEGEHSNFCLSLDRSLDRCSRLRMQN